MFQGAQRQYDDPFPDLNTCTLGLGGFVGTNPIVLRTAPPQPALNASMTISPVAVGGPEASTKGLGNFIPMNSISKCAMIPTSGAQ